ncbi:MAG: hypothetical protein K2H93_08285 [Oscillospiraceae bacterium]|nr:hypothetical protein [Oscillospiraceae bacterium]
MDNEKRIAKLKGKDYQKYFGVTNAVFHLPSRKKVTNSESIKEVAVDVTEIEIERPQKNKGNTIQARKEDTH